MVLKHLATSIAFVSEKSKLRPYTAEEKEDKEQKDKDGDREEAQQ